MKLINLKGEHKTEIKWSEKQKTLLTFVFP